MLSWGWARDDTTYLSIATPANSDYLTGFIGKVVRKLCANKGAEMIGGVLTDLKTELEADHP